ncbi:hypothetical protein FGO68_gene4505 [Halteria grandinella]|uniref:Tubulin--tyrosine ligase-like protein 5 n=1 Tax=Halteria grandinella TaxID=5974 RepID=A0A8J8P4C3_HALGN|nr:hypothetical protein FGO68_gene4505 [Halteria grandinella]
MRPPQAQCQIRCCTSQIQADLMELLPLAQLVKLPLLIIITEEETLKFTPLRIVAIKMLQVLRLVKLTLESNGFKQTESSNFSVCWLGNINNQVNKYQFFENLSEYQKINHFPMSTEITRKDRLAANIKKMLSKFQSAQEQGELDLIPETFILPEQLQEFKDAFQAQIQYNLTQNQSQQKPNIWIVKPSAMSQGKGIFVSNNLNEIVNSVSLLQINPQGAPPSYVVSRYISNPMLINGLKFDLRIYVLVTSFDPCLRVYVYHEGLVRFATEPFSLQNLHQQCSHLTNYSINKKHTNFYVSPEQMRQQLPNEGLVDLNQSKEEEASPSKSQKRMRQGVKANVGNKWSLGALNKHLAEVGIDVKLLWNRIYDSINKCLLAGEAHIIQALRRVLPNRQNCFELFGFDVLIDSNLKPWILEINLSPSLACEAPLDFHIKSRLIADTLNLVQISKPTRRDYFAKVKVQNNQSVIQKQHSGGLSSTMKGQHQIHFETDGDPVIAGLIEDIDALKIKAKETLVDLVKETQRNHKNVFIRIFPTQLLLPKYERYLEASQNSAVYKQLFSFIYNNRILRELPVEGGGHKRTQIGMDVAQTPFADRRDSNDVTPPKDEIVLTGDDLVIEYVTRLSTACKSSSTAINSYISDRLTQFIHYKIWSSQSLPTHLVTLGEKLSYRIDDMKQRKLKLYLSKCQASQDVGRAQFNKSEQMKKDHLENLSDSQIEQFLFSKIDSSKGNEILNFLCVNDSKGNPKGILRRLRRGIEKQQEGASVVQQISVPSSQLDIDMHINESLDNLITRKDLERETHETFDSRQNETEVMKHSDHQSDSLERYDNSNMKSSSSLNKHRNESIPIGSAQRMRASSDFKISHNFKEEAAPYPTTATKITQRIKYTQYTNQPFIKISRKGARVQELAVVSEKLSENMHQNIQSNISRQEIYSLQNINSNVFLSASGSNQSPTPRQSRDNQGPIVFSTARKQDQGKKQYLSIVDRSDNKKRASDYQGQILKKDDQGSSQQFNLPLLIRNNLQIPNEGTGSTSRQFTNHSSMLDNLRNNQALFIGANLKNNTNQIPSYKNQAYLKKDQQSFLGIKKIEQAYQLGISVIGSDANQTSQKKKGSNSAQKSVFLPSPTINNNQGMMQGVPQQNTTNTTTYNSTTSTMISTKNKSLTSAKKGNLAQIQKLSEPFNSNSELVILAESKESGYKALIAGKEQKRYQK